MKRRFLQTVVPLGLFCASGALADWVEHQDKPAWLRRGAVRMASTFGDREKLPQWLDEDPMGFGINLYYGIHWPWELAIDGTAFANDYFRREGGHVSWYICPTSMFWHDNIAQLANLPMGLVAWRYKNFEKYPYAAQSCCIEADGSRKTIYFGDWQRHASARTSDTWLEHVTGIMRWMAHGPSRVENEHLRRQLCELKHPGCPDVYYLDNPTVQFSWDDRTLELWRPYCKKRFGKVEDPRTTADPLVRAAWFNFSLEAHASFFAKLKRAANSLSPPRYTWTNIVEGVESFMTGTQYLDAIYTEDTVNAPPRHWNVFNYKRLLALTHGGAVGLWCPQYPPWIKLAEDNTYRILDWRLTAKAVQLSVAEGMATGATHILHPGMVVYPSYRWGDAIRPYTFFQKANAQLFREAQMGARLAFLYPAASQDRGGPDLQPFADRLMQMGFPIELIVEADLAADRFGSVDAIIVPHAHCLGKARVATLRSFVERGGRLLVSEHFAQRDDEGYPQDTSIAASLLPDSAGARFFYSAPLDMALDGFQPTRAGRLEIPPFGKRRDGRAWLFFNGPAATYRVRVHYYDEWDGVSTMAVELNDREAERWKLDGEDGMTSHTTSPVTLKNGDKITVYGQADMGEYVRWTAVEVLPERPAPREAVTRKIGQGTVRYTPLSLDGLSDAELRRAVTALTGDRHAALKTTDPNARLILNVLRHDDPGAYSFHVLNYTCVSRERYAYFSAPEHRVRLQLELPADLKGQDALLRFLAYGDGKQYELHIAVDGAERPPIPGAQLTRKRWHDVQLPSASLKRTNVVEMWATGQLSRTNNFLALYIDPNAPARGDAWSSDAGRTYATDDLSPLNGAQRGAFKAAIISSKTRKPVVEFCADVTPVRDVELRVPKHCVSRETRALLVSPDHEPVFTEIKQDGPAFTVSIPQVDVYTVAVVSGDEEFLRDTAANSKLRTGLKPWPRTEAFRDLLRRGLVGTKTFNPGFEGDLVLRADAGLDRSSIEVWNFPRSFGKQLKQGTDYEIDDQNCIARTSTTRLVARQRPMLWSFKDGRGAHRMVRHTMWTRYDKLGLIAPGWRLLRQWKVQSVAPVHGEGLVRSGKLAQRVVAHATGGIGQSAAPLDEGRRYCASAWIKVERGEVALVVTGLPTGEVKRTTVSPDYAELSIDFVATNKSHEVRIMATSPEGATFVVDDAAVRERR